MHTEQVREMLRGKRVAIVGGADSWDRAGTSDRDIVVRTNVNWKRQGGRMDAIYTRETEPREEYAGAAVLFVDFEADTDAWIEFAADHGNKLVWFDCQRHRNPQRRDMLWCNEFNWKLGTLPFTGIIAANHMLRFVEPHELLLTGFTFYAGKKNVMPEWVSSHHVPPQVAYLDELRAAGVKMDQALHKLLDKPIFKGRICF